MAIRFALCLVTLAAFVAFAGCSGDSSSSSSSPSGDADWTPPPRGISLPPDSSVRAVHAEPFAYSPAKAYAADVHTTAGDFTIEFYPAETPRAVGTFISLAEPGFYDGLLFFRVKADTIVQTGDPDNIGTGNAGFGLPDEFTDRPFVAGTVGLAHTPNPDSGSCQWFVTLRPMSELDAKYAAFGHVTAGLDVVRKISESPVMDGDAAVPLVEQRPVDPPAIRSITIRTLDTPPPPAQYKLLTSPPPLPTPPPEPIEPSTALQPPAATSQVPAEVP